MLTVLNPALHSRIFYKQALSLQAEGFSVGVAGQHPARAPFQAQGVTVFPMPVFGRLSLRRLFRPLVLFALAWRLRPRVAVVHTPELLGVAILLRLRGIRVVYDVHEDYRANFAAGQGAPRGLGAVVGFLLRIKERLCVPLLHGVVYAEARFGNLLKARAGSWVLVSNKFRIPPPEFEAKPLPPAFDAPPGEPILLHTGTIAPEWGFTRVLHLWAALNQHGPVQFWAAGHCPSAAYWQEISQYVADQGLWTQFAYEGGPAYAPYEVIVAAIKSCTLGMGLYEPLPHFAARQPTKFFEFWAAGKPILFTALPEWVQLNDTLRFGIPDTEYTSSEGIARLYRDLCAGMPHFTPTPPQPGTDPWALEGQKLLAFYAPVVGRSAGKAS